MRVGVGVSVSVGVGVGVGMGVGVGVGVGVCVIFWISHNLLIVNVRILSLPHECGGRGLFYFFFTPHRASPPIQFDRIASAARRVIAPWGSKVKGIVNTSPIGSCSGYPATPSLQRPDVRSRR